MVWRRSAIDFEKPTRPPFNQMLEINLAILVEDAHYAQRKLGISILGNVEIDTKGSKFLKPLTLWLDKLIIQLTTANKN